MKKLGFGCMRLPLTDANDPTKIDLQQTKQMVDLFMAKGFTYFDTAYPYHNGYSERAVAEAVVKRYPRDSFTIADKMPTFFMLKAEDLERIFAEQLQRLGTDYIDYYLLHNPHGEMLDNAEAIGAFEFVKRKKAEGRIRHIGFSLHDTPEMIDAILKRHPEMDFVQIQLNYVDWENAGIQARRCYEVCAKHGKPVMVMEPVKGGTLTNLPDDVRAMLEREAPDASMASWAIRYAASLEGVQVVLSGMSTLQQVQDNVGYMDDFQPLSERERAVIGRAVDAINAAIAIPCTGCGYCLKSCPKHIPIPTYFALYNAEQQDSKDGWKPQGDYYRSIAVRESPASACMKCGKCEQMCPQHLKIRALLEDVAKTFEG